MTGVLLEKNVGQQMATYLGLAHVLDCDFVATMDDDGQHPVSLLEEMLEKLQAGADLCLRRCVAYAGIPSFAGQGPPSATCCFSLCTDKPWGIRVSAYRVMTVALARKLAPEPDGYIYLSAAAFKHKPRTECVDSPGAARENFILYGSQADPAHGGLLVHYTPVRVFFPQKAGGKPNDGPSRKGLFMKTVMLLGGSNIQMSAAVRLKQMGCRVILADYTPNPRSCDFGRTRQDRHV